MKNTDKTAEEIIRNRDDEAMISNPDIWPKWPLLPLKKVVNGELFVATCVAYADGENIPVHIGVDMWSYSKGEAGDLRRFESAAAIVAAGWVVD